MDINVGDIIHGFAQGHFGRDSYSCRRVEHIGPDYIVTRSYYGPEMVAGVKDIKHLASIAGDRSFCDESCDGPESLKYAS